MSLPLRLIADELVVTADSTIKFGSVHAVLIDYQRDLGRSLRRAVAQPSGLQHPLEKASWNSKPTQVALSGEKNLAAFMSALDENPACWERTRETPAF